MVAIITATEVSVVLIPSAYADANCDKAQLEQNDQFRVRGNAQQCSTFGGEGEQTRSCHSPNAFKDNDEDGTASCIFRGNL
jgi:hypothetical protein